MALRSPVETHPYWGIFATYANLPNVTGSPTQSPNLEVGDQAYVNGVLYVCITSTLGAAVWARANNAAGIATLDFGPWPGGTDATLAIVGQADIVASSVVEATIALVATPDHSVDEQRVNPLYISAGNIVPGTGFTLYAQAIESTEYGKWSVAWSWF